MYPLPILMDERVKIEDKAASAVLHATADSNTAETLQELVSGSELDIFSAARQGKTQHIQALIESGRARATDSDDDNITALHWATISGRTETCEYLIDQGAQVNAVGHTLLATPLQWAARQGHVGIIHLLIQHGANPHLFDSQGYNCLHSVTHSSSYLALLYILCQPDVVVDERDHKGRTALHWAVYQCDDVSTCILLQFGADPDAADRGGRTALHWAVVGGNKSCIDQLFEAGADIGAQNLEQRTARDLSDEFHNLDTWNKVFGEKGFREDGTRVRRPLTESHIKMIVFSVPTLSLCIVFSISKVFPWYISIILAPTALVAMHLIVLLELLNRQSVRDSIYASPYFAGIIFGSALWMVYAWVTRLRYGAPDRPYIHTAFAFLFFLCMFAFICTIFCDPGTCATPTRDALKPIIEDLVQSNHLMSEAFCVRCLSVKVPFTRHCSMCNRCVTHHESMDLHVSWMLNCIGRKNHIYFIIFVAAITAGIPIFDYLVWIYLDCDSGSLRVDWRILPHVVCRCMSVDMFVSSVALWSTLQLMWSGVIGINYASTLWKAWERSVKTSAGGIVTVRA